MRVLLSLSTARLRHRPARWWLVALGVALATALPIWATAVSVAIASEAMRHGVAELPAGERSLAAIRQGLRETPERIAELDTAARRALVDLSAGPVRVQMLTRAISDGTGGSYYFGGADGLPGLVRLLDGRLPTSCTPTRCEVIAVGTGTARPPAGIEVVGRAVRTDPLLLSGSFDPGDGAPLLLADGVAAAAQFEYLSAFQRSYSWVTPVDLDRVDALGVEEYLAHSARASIALYAERLTLTAPDEVLRSQAARADISARRFTLLIGAGAALLLGFAAIGAIGLRRDHAAAVRLLRRRGARRGMVVGLAAVTALVPVLAGAAVGLLVGAALAAWRAQAAGLPFVGSTLEAVRGSLLTVGLGTLAAVVIVAVTLAAGAAEDDRPRNGARMVDLTIAATVAVGALALARGAVGVGGLAGGNDPILLALPVLAVLCGGLLVGRVFPFVTVAVASWLPRRRLAARLALVGAVRRPLRPVATAAFLAAATAIVAFAGAYQTTLRAGAVDQATFAVPLDATVRTGQSLRPPLSVATEDEYAAIGAQIHPVVRSSASVRINAAQSRTPELIGVDPDALPQIPEWDDVVGGSDPRLVRQALRPVPVAEHPGVAVPAGTRTLAFAAAGDLADVDMSAWVRLPNGRDVGVPLRLVTDAATGDRLVADLSEPLPTAGRLYAVTLTENSFAATRRQHRIGEGDFDAESLTGRVELRAQSPISGDWTQWSSDTSTVTAMADGLAIDYALTGAEVVARAAAPASPLPVFVDPLTADAAVNGLLQLEVGGETPIAARVAGVLPRFPTTGGAFVVADVRAIADALDARDPGTGSVSELWLVGDELSAALAAAPFDLLRVDVRAALIERLASDPVALGAATLLTGSALVAFAMALLALVLLVIAEQRDEAAQLYAWESDGVGPRTLRLSLFLRALAVVAVAIPGGVVVGLLLSRITTALIRVTATGADPMPPLVLTISPLWTVGTIGVGLAVGLGACAAVAIASLREPLPRRPEEVLT